MSLEKVRQSGSQVIREQRWKYRGFREDGSGTESPKWADEVVSLLPASPISLKVAIVICSSLKEERKCLAWDSFSFCRSSFLLI